MFTDWASSLLLLAKQLFGPGICPGDWIWATSMYGAIVALLPIAAAVTIAIIRKVTATSYTTTTVSIFGGITAVLVLLVPLALLIGMSEVFRSINAGNRAGINVWEVQMMHTSYCEPFGKQSVYLGQGRNVFEMLFYPQGTLHWVFYLGALVGLPLLALIFIMLQGRLAFRRGPKWPVRLMWVPFLLLVLLSVPMTANSAVHMWLGFVPVTILGLLPVAMVGAPSPRMVAKSERRQAKRDQPPPPPRKQVQPPPPEPTPPPPRKELPPTAVAPVAPVPVTKPASTSRYDRIRRLGHGGFGTVWEAVDTQLDRRVALKIAHAPDRDTEERMQREAKALAAVNHPNCVRVYDLIEEPDGLALVMEYVEGNPLSVAVDDTGTIDDTSAARLWSTMAGALSAAHSKGVLHRDVKPSNVIVDPAGVGHLIDFGIARSKGDSTLTATGMMIGTPDYTAPEIANGSPATPASDAWQLAATVSYALTGQPPRGERETPMAALMAAARSEPLARLPKNSVHTKLLRAALDPEPRNRPTLQAVVQEMDTWLKREGESAKGPITRMWTRQIPRR